MEGRRSSAIIARVEFGICCHVKKLHFVSTDTVKVKNTVIPDRSQRLYLVTSERLKPKILVKVTKTQQEQLQVIFNRTLEQAVNIKAETRNNF